MANIVSIVFQLPAELTEHEHFSFRVIAEIKRVPTPIQSDRSADATSNADDLTPQYIMWKGRLLKHTVPFLCVGDN